MAGIPAVVWRVTEGKGLPMNIQLGATCCHCGCTLEVLFRLRDMATKLERLRCPLCTGHDMKLLSARALGGR